MSTFLRWMPLDVTDYLNDTGHLTTLQHGAYMLLLMHYWRHGPLPDDDEQLAAITKTDAKTWKAVRGTIRRFFHQDNGELHQKRADQERDKAQDISTKRKIAGGIRRPPPTNGGANAQANAPPNAGTNAPPNGNANAEANAEQMVEQLCPHNVPSTDSDLGSKQERQVSKNNNLLSFPGSGREVEPTAAQRIEAQNINRKVGVALDADEGKRLKRELFKDPVRDRWDQAKVMRGGLGAKPLTPEQLAVARKRAGIKVTV